MNVNPEGYDHNKYGPRLFGEEPVNKHLGGGFISFITPDDNNKTPKWVSYQLNQYNSNRGSNYPPSRHKRYPWPTIDNLYNKDAQKQPIDATYYNSSDKWTVGLLAPRGDMNRISKAYGCNAYVYANAAPFSRNLYHGIWRGMENYASSLSNQYKKLWVTTGPIYEQKEIEYIGKTENNEQLIAIPDKYFKVILYESDEGIHILSFIYPNKNTKQKAYLSGNCQQDKQYNHTPYLVSLSDIEQATGLVFFPDALSDITAIKQQKAKDLPAIEQQYRVGYCM